MSGMADRCVLVHKKYIGSNRSILIICLVAPLSGYILIIIIILLKLRTCTAQGEWERYKFNCANVYQYINFSVTFMGLVKFSPQQWAIYFCFGTVVINVRRCLKRLSLCMCVCARVLECVCVCVRCINLTSFHQVMEKINNCWLLKWKSFDTAVINFFVLHSNSILVIAANIYLSLHPTDPDLFTKATGAVNSIDVFYIMRRP